MRFSKKVMMSSLTAVLALTIGGSGTFAASESTTSNESDPPMHIMVNWTGTTYVSQSSWVNITSSNNLFPDSPLVTNHISNPGRLKVRIINSNGAQVGQVKYVSVGQSVRMDQIPAFSGTYTLQAIAEYTAGSYTISID